jgi:hypothetical protein
MPNGKPGDHPLTDIVIHGTDLLGDGLDDVVRALCKTRPDLRGKISGMLWENMSGWGDKFDPERRVAIRAALDRLASTPAPGT